MQGEEKEVKKRRSHNAARRPIYHAPRRRSLLPQDQALTSSSEVELRHHLLRKWPSARPASSRSRTLLVSANSAKRPSFWRRLPENRHHHSVLRLGTLLPRISKNYTVSFLEKTPLCQRQHRQSASHSAQCQHRFSIPRSASPPCGHLQPRMYIWMPLAAARHL